MALNIQQLSGPGGKGGNPANPATTPAFEPVTGDQNSLTQFMRSMQNALAQQGNTLTAKGGATAAPGINFLSKLAGGGASLDEATMPEQDQITDAFNRVRQMISTMPRGGGKASAEVQAPYQGIKDIAELKSRAKTGAASELAGIGLQEEGLGLEGEKAAALNALTTRAQDIEGGTANTFATFASAIRSLI